MKTVEIFDEKNLITIDTDYDNVDFYFFPEDKRFKVERSIKDDYYYTNDILEYKILVNPIEIYIRTLESSSKPPLEYQIKDGVVLESQIINSTNKILSEMKKEWVEELKKEVEWNKVELLGNYEVNLYILSKHPEIISPEEYRKFLRQSIERIKKSVAMVEDAVKNDANNLQICKYESNQYIKCLDGDIEEKEIDKYLKLSEEEKEKSEYGNKMKYLKKFKDSLFKKGSSKYINISEYEFESSIELIEYIENLLDKKETVVIKKEDINPQQNNINKIIGVIVYLLTGFFIILKLTDGVDWNWFAVISPVLIWEGLGFVIGFLRGFSK